MEQGWDPEVKRFFRKIINSIAMGLLWLMSALTAGLYFGLAHHSNPAYLLLFYTGLATSLFFLIRYYYRTWR
jgi:hypothetical protein